MRTIIATLAIFMSVISGPSAEAKPVTPRMTANTAMHCKTDGRTHAVIKFHNMRSFEQKYYYVLYPSDIFMAWGDGSVPARDISKAYYNMSPDTTMEVFAYAKKGKLRILHTTLHALDC